MKFLPNVVAALVAGLLVNASVLYAEENDNCLAVVPSDYQWTNPSFTYTKNSVSRGNQSSNTDTVMQKEFAGDLGVAAKVELLGLGYSDGKGILIQGKNGYLMSVALDDSAPLIMWSTKQSKVVSSVQGVPTVLGRKYGFHIKVTETTITGTVDGFVVSAPNELTPPYKIGIIAQRSGIIVSDIVVCESKNINLDDPDIRNKILECALINLDDPDIRNKIRNKLLEGALTYDELEIRDKEGKVIRDKQGEYFYHAHNSKEPYTGWVKQTARAGQIGDQSYYLQRVKDGKKHGMHTRWSENGQKQWEANYVDGKKHGLQTGWNRDGAKSEANYYRDGKMQRRIWWHKNGQKKTEFNYKDGKPHGLDTQWYENGQKWFETNYVDGKEHGLKTQWHENGQKWLETNYVDGKKHGLKTVWYKNGQKKSETNYVDGKLPHADACAINMRNLHQACRASQNLNKYKTGEPIIWDDITGKKGSFIEVTPQCPLGGRYILEDHYTEEGKPMARCSNAETHFHMRKSVDGLINGGAIKVIVRDFASIDNALLTYRNNAGNFPSGQQGLSALVEKPSSSPRPRRWIQIMDQVPKDPWGNEYVYKYPRSRYELISYGADGLEGSKDDISSEDPR